MWTSCAGVVIVAGMLTSNVSYGQDKALDRRAFLDAAESIASVVSSEYFDAAVGGRAAAHLREFAAGVNIGDGSPARLASIMLPVVRRPCEDGVPIESVMFIFISRSEASINRSNVEASISFMSSTGTSIRSFRFFFAPASTMVTGL